MTVFFVVVIAYLLGSICSAVIVARLFSLPDPRIEGSKNPGATNILRLAGKKYAAIVLICDMLKGLLPVLLGHFLSIGSVGLSFICLAAVMGHMYPLFFRFQGGKGVATAIGALLGLNILLGIVVIATWLLAAKFTQYASLASLISLILAPILALVTIGNFEMIPALFFIALFILYQHRNNITRLIDGDEPKIKSSHSLKEEINEFLTQPTQEEQIEEEEEKLQETEKKD